MQIMQHQVHNMPQDRILATRSYHASRSCLGLKVTTWFQDHLTMPNVSDLGSKVTIPQVQILAFKVIMPKGQILAFKVILPEVQTLAFKVMPQGHHEHIS